MRYRMNLIISKNRLRQKTASRVASALCVMGATGFCHLHQAGSPLRTDRGDGGRLFSNKPLDSSLARTIETTLNWNDRIRLQDHYSLEEKGWKVQVDWRPTPFGAGLFAKECISAGTVLRTGVIGVNLKEFASIAEIDAFCQQGRGPEEVTARRDYVKDYLWGFNKKADSRGYDQLDPAPDRFFGMWIPGNGLNHCMDPNTVYKPTSAGIDLVALEDIAVDDELFDDYRRHGNSPDWLKQFAAQHNVTLNFADCNDFVGS